MEPLKTEVNAFWDVMMTPPAEFVTAKEREAKGDEWAEKMAHDRMAKVAIKAVDRARGERTLWMVVLRHGAGSSTIYTGYGPHATKAQAEKAYTGLATTLHHTAYAVVPMRNAEGLASLLEQADADPPTKGDWAVLAEDGLAFKAGWNGKQNARAKFLERVM